MKKFFSFILLLVLVFVFNVGVVFGGDVDDVEELNERSEILQGQEDFLAQQNESLNNERDDQKKIVDDMESSLLSEITKESDLLNKIDNIKDGTVDVVDPDTLVELEKKLEEKQQEISKIKKNLSSETEKLNESEAALDKSQRELNDAKDSAFKKSVLPSTSLTISECKDEMNEVNMDPFSAREKFVARNDAFIKKILGCAVKTGDIKLWMIPYYVRFILEFIIQVSGLIAVGGIVYGGYYYMFGGLIDDSERGKQAIIYSLVGIALMTAAWGIVNIVLSFLTS